MLERQGALIIQKYSEIYILDCVYFIDHLRCEVTSFHTFIFKALVILVEK